MSSDDTNKPKDVLESGDERDVICTVACIELVDYAHKPATEQMRIKAQCAVLLTRALADIPASERIVLDTANGMTIIFLCSPERCLGFGLTLRSELASPASELVRMRIGLNLGPVRMIESINGEPDFIGDGLTGGERIAGFADPNDVVASHSLYEAIVGLSRKYAECFSSPGLHTDSQRGERKLYSLRGVLPPITFATELPSGRAEKVRAGLRRITSSGSTIGAHVMRRPQVATVLAVACILVVAMGLRQAWQGAVGSPALDASAEAASGPLPSRHPPAEPALQASDVDAEKDTNTATWPLPSGPTSPKYVPAAPAAQRGSIAGESGSRSNPESQVVSTGAVRLTIAPWGEIYLDGEKLGVSPPLRDIALEPGVYRIEVRNPGFASHLSVVEVNAGEEIRIRHRFD